jgi:membrane-associated phospholipid phosphatase
MRLYEWISLVFYAAFGGLAWTRTLPARRRAIVTGIAVAGVGGILTMRSTTIRDWLPLAFIPLAYWQTGQFVLPLNQSFQSRLESLDRKYLRSGLPPFMWLLELAYLFCYPLVPLGLVALYLSGMGRFAEEFWNVVLPPAYACYATFPFVQTLPPRAIERDVPWQPRRTPLRKLNLFVLRHISIQANTFPSGHVAASFAVSLELLAHSTAAGCIFLLMSVAVAGGAFWGRYHYGLDVLIGALMAIVSFLLGNSGTDT